MTRFHTVSLAGFAATAITFGPGRMGFGMFLSEFRDAFALTSSMAGVISGLGFFSFFLGLLGAYALLSAGGPRWPVVTGLSLAGCGMALVALATGSTLLTLGVMMSMSSAGLTWAPFNTAVHRAMDDQDRPRALSIVSTGTAIGVASAGGLALWLGLTAISWRVAWAIFVAGAIAAGIANVLALRGLTYPDDTTHGRWSDLIDRRALPLYSVALCFGITTAVFISFAADRIQQAGGLPGLPGPASSAIVFTIYGLCGLAGLATGRIKLALGLPALVRSLLIVSAVSHAAVALAPTGWAGVTTAAGLQGVYVMMSSAIFAFWSERLFPAMPGTGFTAALLVLAIGSVAGSILAGAVFDQIGGAAVFLAAGALSAGLGLILRSDHLHERRRTAAHAG